FGINKITVSSIEMALYFRKLGFRDITIAFPVNVREHKKLKQLSANTKLGLLVSNSESALMLTKLAGIKSDIWIEIDTGYNRSGIEWNNFNEIDNCINTIQKSTELNFKGFLTHNGLTYSLNDKKSILDSARDSISKMQSLKTKNAELNPLISIGDTPSCSIITDFPGIDEIRPGNFVYYDLMMLRKGMCTQEQIAATVFCPITDINNKRSEIVIHGGAIHFSKEYIEINGQKCFGKVIQHIGRECVVLEENIVSLSQEHGIIKIGNSNISSYHPGDLLEIIPVHSCLTANLMKGKTMHW
ncbi:MAG: alanine racemase, partial [Bacteroidales bacterium]|nr:alanine racemase [Bacteroidales bacterium]